MLLTYDAQGRGQQDVSYLHKKQEISSFVPHLPLKSEFLFSPDAGNMGAYGMHSIPTARSNRAPSPGAASGVPMPLQQHQLQNTSLEGQGGARRQGQEQQELKQRQDGQQQQQPGQQDSQQQMGSGDQPGQVRWTVYQGQLAPAVAWTTLISQELDTAGAPAVSLSPDLHLISISQCLDAWVPWLALSSTVGDLLDIAKAQVAALPSGSVPNKLSEGLAHKDLLTRPCSQGLAHKDLLTQPQTC